MYYCYIFTSSIQYTSIKLDWAVYNGSLKSLQKNIKGPRYIQNHHWDFAIVLSCWQHYISSKRVKKKQLSAQEGDWVNAYSSAMQLLWIIQVKHFTPVLSWLSQMWPSPCEGMDSFPLKQRLVDKSGKLNKSFLLN